MSKKKKTRHVTKSRKRRAQPTAQWLTALGGAASANDPGSGHADLTSGRYDAITWAALALTAEKKHYQLTYNVTFLRFVRARKGVVVIMGLCIVHSNNAFG